jgi:hypothetical protein
VQKLSNILKSLEATQQHLDLSIAAATGTPTPATDAQRAGLERQIASVERQLRTHEAQVDSLKEGRGYVAREDDEASGPGPSPRSSRRGASNSRRANEVSSTRPADTHEAGPTVAARPDNVGHMLHKFIEQMKAHSTDGVAPGGTFRIDTPEGSVALHLNPENLYIERITLSREENGQVTERALSINVERYPSDRPLSILRQEQIESLVRGLQGYSGKFIDLVALDGSGIAGGRYRNLTDLIAMVAEGTRFPAIGESIRLLEAGEDPHVDLFVHGGSELDKYIQNRTGLKPGSSVEGVSADAKRAALDILSRYQHDRIIPRYWANDWAAGYANGDAIFRNGNWKAADGK